METGIDSVSITIEGKQGSVELTQTQPAGAGRHGSGPRAGKDLLDAAVRDARAWLRANGGKG